MRILVAGTGRLGAAVLELLLNGPHHVSGLVLNGRRIKGRLRRQLHVSPLGGQVDPAIRIAKRWALPLVWLDPDAPGSLDRIASLEPDLLITCGFGIILREPLLTLPRVGCVNVHSSLLPKHRGPMPFNWVILHGDSQTGVTFHVTTAVVDGGDILDQRAIPVTDRDTAVSVYNRCCELARHRIAHVVDAIESDGLHGTPQNEDEATYDPPLTAADLRIDWSRSATEVDRTVRAGTPYLPARFQYRNRLIAVERTLPLDASTAGLQPGTVVATEPHVTVATGTGCIAIVRAAVTSPVLWPWPNAFSRPRAGSILQ